MHKGMIVSNWDKFDEMGGLENPTAQRFLRGALNTFLLEPQSAPFKLAAQAFADTGDMSKAKSTFMQAFATSDDFPDSVLQVLDKYHRSLYFDTGYEQIFKSIDMRNSNRDSFQILDVISGLTFDRVPQGEKAHIYKFSGAKATVTLDMYGAGLGWARQLFMNKEYWTIEDNAFEFRNKAGESKAQDHYDLIEATAPTYDLPWQLVNGAVSDADKDYIPIRDINTINQACENILTRLQDLGMSVTPNSEFVILAPIQLKGRIPRALGLVQQPFGGSTNLATYNVRVIYTLMLTETDKYYVILPGNKIQTATRMDLTVFSDFDIEAFTDIAVGWQWYGAAIGETKQIVRCETA